MRVLITNLRLCESTGTELYVRDVALELQRQGHLPAVCSPWLGRTAEVLIEAGIPVASSLRRLSFRPDIIHGHHQLETLSAVLRFPDVPAIFICHDHKLWADKAPLHPRILRYCGVSKLCMERIRESGVPEGRIGQLHNFVDMERFRPRSPLPTKPHRALVFSNYASERNYVPVVAEACRQAGLELEVVGDLAQNPVERPEDVLGQYDIVFAKAKAAMEAMATGCAVVLCDTGGLGPMVTQSKYEQLRPLNFGFEALADAHTVENVLNRISQYSPQDAQAVRDTTRSSAGLENAVARLLEVYGQVIEEYRAARPVSSRFAGVDHRMAMGRRTVICGGMKLWGKMSPASRRSPAVCAVRRGIQYVLSGFGR